MAKVRVEQLGLVAEIVIDGPPLNLFDEAMIADFEVALAEVTALANSGAARAVLLRAEGRVFCGGVDVHEFMDLTHAQGTALLNRCLALTTGMEALPVPTLALVEALNLTIGFEVSLGCDLMWASEKAEFGLVETTVGLTPAAGGTQRLVARAGAARAAELILTGDVYPAKAMHEWGVVNRIRPADTILAEAREHIAALAAGPTIALAVGKRLVATARDHGVKAADAITAQTAGALYPTEDLQGGIRSLLENGPRKATFNNR